MLDIAPGNQRQNARDRMVEGQIAARGVVDTYVLEAMRTVPREYFIPEDADNLAYEDMPLPIGYGQTISQPYIVALMSEIAELHPTDKVLEIGTGSGYGAAILSRIAEKVFTIEVHEGLALRADNILKDLGYDNVTVLHRDGSAGLPEEAPFDAIVVTAGAPVVPEVLRQQLKTGGRLVIPVGPDERRQRLFQISRRSEDKYETLDYGPVAFVPLVGEQGWDGRKAG
jgi:protein-L-isoaspartate(D-aspartate) O-methyltransferase